MSAATNGVRRARLSRTVARGRWPEYRRFLDDGRRAGYELLGLEQWVDRGFPAGERILILRHDVDQHPASALRMLAIERDLGVRATWYFRWRTAQPAVIEEVARSAAGVGLHYETLTRTHLARPDSDRVESLEHGRKLLRAELRAFAKSFGPVRSACPHGDSRVAHLRNGDLLRDEDCASYGLEFDGNEIMRGKRIGHWLTDRSAPDGHWGDGVRPAEMLEQGTSPILCVIHPNNWVSGASLWADRTLGAVLPAGAAKGSGRRLLPPLTCGDDPPVGHD